MSNFRIGATVPVAAACLALSALLPPDAMAQSQLDPVVVTGTREPQPLSRSTADIVVIGADTVRNSTADSVEDLLRREAGMQLTRSGGPGQSSGYFIRGASTSGTVVLIDGIRIGSATLGQADFASLSLAQIDHIEVLRGPASSLYGADAVGGVVQIFTRRGAGAPRFVAHAAAGGYSSQQGDLGVSGSQGKLDYSISAGRERSDGVSAIRPNDRFGAFNPDKDGYLRSFGQANLGYELVPGHRVGVSLMQTRLNAQYDSDEFNPPSFKADPTPDFRNHLTTKLASIDYRGEVSSLWTSSVRASTDIEDASSGGTTQSRFKTDREQVTWQNALHFDPDQQLLLGYDYLRESVMADVFTVAPGRNNNAAILGYTGTFGKSVLETSLRHDRNSVYGNVTTGRLGLGYQVTPEIKVRALGGTTFRAPTFNDLFYPGFGVPTVQPEKGKSFEVGAQWQSEGTDAGVTVYRNEVKDLIGFEPDAKLCPPDPVYKFGCAANTSRARLQGATLTVAQRTGGLFVRAVLDVVDAKDRESGVRLARRAAHQESLVADYNVGAWTFGSSLLNVGSRPDGGVVLGGYALVGLRANWRFASHWRLETSVLNALDHCVEPLRDYQGLGRQAWIGVRYDGKGF